MPSDSHDGDPRYLCPRCGEDVRRPEHEYECVTVAQAKLKHLLDLEREAQEASDA